MKTAIITLPLHTNYGGVLQAYALKSFLVSLGHEVTVIDRKEKMPAPKGLKAPFIYAKRMLMRLLKGESAPEVFREKRFREELPAVAAKITPFIESEIAPRLLDSYKDICEGEYDALIVGSDQVWRPLYFGRIEDAFLDFAKDWEVVRVAYAASFGTDRLEYDYSMLEKCSDLLARFNAVSVREDSAVKACEEWFDFQDAVHVLDPVMLLDVSQYRNMADKAPEHPGLGRIVEYILDTDSQKKAASEFMSRVSGKDIYTFKTEPYNRKKPIQERIAPSIEQWIAAFSDADFVVTDSFHGCVLCILFHKPFIAVGNPARGNARLKSLLDMFGLDQLFVHGIDPEDDGTFFLDGPDWDKVEGILAQMREKSSSFLKNSLK